MTIGTSAPFSVVVASAAMAVLTACGAGNSSQASTKVSGSTPAHAVASAAAGAVAGGSASDYCALAGPANAALAASADATGDAPAAAQLKANIQSALAAAPAEIKGDVQVMADIEMPILDGRVPQDQIDKQVGDPRMLTAMRHIAEWSRNHCPAASPNP